MNYFQPYPLGTDDSVASAWESQVKESAKTPWLEKKLVERANELVPVFVAAYRELRALPRSARRTVQRQLSRSAELRDILRQSTHQPLAAELQRKLAYSLAGAALLLALGQGVAAAATIKVTTNNPNINDGDRKCSLIEAIVNANDDARTFRDCRAGSGADTIVLPKKTITLTAAYDYSYGPTGLPVITSQITIQGNGAKIIRQQPSHENPVVPEFRLIAVSSSGDLTLKQVNLSGGYSQNEGNDYRGYGGAVFNNGNLTIIGSTISGNTAGGGGGLYNAAYLAIANSTISENTATYAGGGIDNTGGTLTITNSMISGNKAEYFFGGGVYNTGYLTIANSTISGNTGTIDGGGIDNTGGTVTITNSMISGNATEYTGGGVANFAYTTIPGYLTITNSMISGNIVGSESEFVTGGGVFNDRSVVTIQNSTISGNTVRSDSGRAEGGGVFNQYSSVTIENSTISGNSVSSHSYFAEGGGVSDNFDTVTIENSTISGNTVRSDSYPARGGGVYINSGVLTLDRSLISGNEAINGPEIDNEGTVIADDFNLFGSNGNAGVTGFTPGLWDIVPTPRVELSKILGPLKNNGGPTQTHALVKGSPAVDTIPLSDPSCTGTDQRGVARPRGHGCDIGAFEK